MADTFISERESKDLSIDWVIDNEEEVWELDLLTGSSVGDLETVKNLLGHGLGGTVQNSSGWTPLMYASYFGHSELVTFLVSTQLYDVGGRNINGRNALMLSSYCGQVEVVKVILEICKDIELINMTDPHGWTALFYASAMGHDLVVNRLLASGADLHHRSNDGENCLTLARRRGHDRVLNTILQHHELTTSIFAGPIQTSALLNKRRASQEGVKLGDVDNMEDLLLDLGLEKYYPIFQSKGIELIQFANMTDQELKDLGISLLGPRRKLTSAMGIIRERFQ